MITTALLLTLIRLVGSPLIIPIIFVTFLGFDSFYSNSFAAGVFLLLALTDLLDGVIARRFNQESKLGRLLDPIADKFLLSSDLITLQAVDKLCFVWVLIFILREFFVMGLRIIALAHGHELRVTSHGKLKTALQMSALVAVIFEPMSVYNGLWHAIVIIMLTMAAALSILSATQYYRSLITVLERSQIL